MSNLSSNVGREIAAGLDENPNLDALMTSFIGNLNTAAGSEMAQGLNQNSASGGPGFLTSILGYTSPGVAAAAIQAINALPANPIENNLMYQLVSHLDPRAADDIANGVNNNPNLLKELLSKLDGTKMAQALNASEPFLTALVDHLDGQALANAINRALDPNDPETLGRGQTFIGDLLNKMDGSIFARALNDNQALFEKFLDQASAIGLGTTWQNLFMDSHQGDPEGFLTKLLKGLDAGVVSQAINDSFNYRGDPRLPYYNPAYPDRPCTFFDVTWFHVDALAFGQFHQSVWVQLLGTAVNRWNP